MNDPTSRFLASATGRPPGGVWRGLVVDDDEGSHRAVALALDGFFVFGSPVVLDCASSAAQAKAMLSGEPVYAFALIDVMMERREAGLELVDWIREQPTLAALRVAMRSGYSGAMSAGEIIQKYDISDFRAKSELSSSQLLAVVASMARSWLEVSAAIAGERAMAAWARGAQDLAQAATPHLFLSELARAGRDVLSPWSFEVEAEGGEPALGACGFEGSGHWVRAAGLPSIRARFDGGRCWPAQEVAALRLLDSARGAYGQLASMRSLEALAYTDTLTGLPNRRRLAQWLDEAQNGAPLAAMILDVDHFKRVNDRLGHEAGDKLLKVIGERMGAACEAMAARAARLGGDEFCVLFRAETPERGVQAAQAWLNLIGGAVQLGVERCEPTFSAGLAWSVDFSASELLRQADVAMYQAKTLGRSRLCPYEAGMGMDAPKREREQRVAQGVASGELVPMFQPIVRAGHQGACVGFEILARWRKPDGSLALAADFLPMAQDGGASRSIDAWVASRAMRASQDIQARVQMRINLDARQARDPGFAAELAAAWRGAPQGAFAVEVLESAALPDLEAAKAFALAVGALGQEVSLDGFGSGQASLGLLSRLPLSSIKVPAELCRAPEGSAERLLGQAAAHVAALRGLPCVAFGVETEQEAALASSWGMAQLQGNVVAPPMPWEQAKAWLEQRERLVGVRKATCAAASSAPPPAPEFASLACGGSVS
jgi:diguanylate cyclase (GGDEF)-like protein